MNYKLFLLLIRLLVSGSTGPSRNIIVISTCSIWGISRMKTIFPTISGPKKKKKDNQRHDRISVMSPHETQSISCKSWGDFLTMTTFYKTKEKTDKNSLEIIKQEDSPQLQISVAYHGRTCPDNHLCKFSKVSGWARNRTGTGNRNRRNRFRRNRTRNRNRRNRFPGTETGTGTVLSVKLY